MSYTYNIVRKSPFDGIQREGQPGGRHILTRYPRYVVNANNDGPVVDLGFFKDRSIGLIIIADKIDHDNKMLADQFAEAGFSTMMILNTAQKIDSVTLSVVQMAEKAIAEIANIRQNKKLRIVVAAFGCSMRQIIDLIKLDPTPKDTLEAFFIASPTIEPLDYSINNYGFALMKPLSLALTDYLTKEQSAVQHQLHEAVRGTGGVHQINYYSHVREGFASRRAVATRAEAYAKKVSFIQALQWFHTHLFDTAKSVVV